MNKCFAFRHREFAAIVALSLALLVSCSSDPPVPAAGGAQQRPIPAGNLQTPFITYEFAVYYLPRPTAEPLVVLEQLLKDKFSVFQRVEKLQENENEPTVVARIEENPRETYAPPDGESLQRFGRGVNADQAVALQTTEAALIVTFHYSADHVWDVLRQASQLIEEVARGTGGLIWDEATREVFSPDAWQERRIADWTEAVPDLSRHTVIHAYQNQNGEFIRAITLGMEKFGLPDVVVDGFSWSLNQNVGILMNLFAQAIGEGQQIQREGAFDLDIRKIQNPRVRDPQIAALAPKATGIALLSLREGRPEEGDPNNRLIEITFERGRGPDTHAQREQILAATFGVNDSVSEIEHNDAIKEASRQARTKLPALREAFNKGLAPGEVILVKVPFPIPEGQNEWMWVEVSGWNGNKIKGLLQNEPYRIPDLHAGQLVQVSEDDVFDYIHRLPDGKTEGNGTAKLIEQQGK